MRVHHTTIKFISTILARYTHTHKHTHLIYALFLECENSYIRFVKRVALFKSFCFTSIHMNFMPSFNANRINDDVCHGHDNCMQQIFITLLGEIFPSLSRIRWHYIAASSVLIQIILRSGSMYNLIFVFGFFASFFFLLPILLPYIAMEY